ncbi:transposase [Candidatus Aalborgicola defluviihabitans]|uniref:transposase n=1 Tax=Candidatus Aalborgicola defluviihabitans TaxID=3386187 RepID=UPI0039B88741
MLEARIAQLERELAAIAKFSPACTTLLSIPGIGLLTATALVAATSGDVSTSRCAAFFQLVWSDAHESARAVAAIWGRISKKGIATCACC